MVTQRPKVRPRMDDTHRLWSGEQTPNLSPQTVIACIFLADWLSSSFGIYSCPFYLFFILSFPSASDLICPGKARRQGHLLLRQRDYAWIRLASVPVASRLRVS